MIKAHTNMEFLQDCVSFWLVDEGDRKRGIGLPVTMQILEAEGMFRRCYTWDTQVRRQVLGD